MTAPVLSSQSLPVGAQLAVLVAWDDSLNAGAGGFALVKGSSGAVSTGATIVTGDIEIGAVELKNASTDDRASINAAGELLTTTTPPSTGTLSNVSGAASSTTILAANASRKGATVFNDSTATLYLALANVTASTTSYSVQISASGFYELPVSQGGVYTGIIKGIWASATGAARVTELT